MTLYHRVWLGVLITLGPVAVRSETPTPVALHQRIDQAVRAAHCGPVAEPASDAEFLRRCFLDFSGRIPSAREVESFLADEDANKRARAIDERLQSDEFNDFFSMVLDLMLMERRGGTRIEQDQWRAFLRESLAANQPFDQLARSILAADGLGEEKRGAAKFLLSRDVEPNALTRDVGRMFLGRDLQCAQCHDHPNIDDYLQSEYYGVFAFLNRSYLFEDEADNKKAYVGERAEGATEFKSVFFPDDDTSSTLPQLINGLRLDVEPPFSADPYVVAPSKSTAGIPRFSRRVQLARLLTHSSNKHFARNIANRLWAHMMGRGIVEPVDFHHRDNPPSLPALMEVLTDGLIAMEFNIREFLRQVAQSNAYQRSIDFPTAPADSTDIWDRRVKEIEEQLAALQGTAAALTEASSVHEARLQSERSRVTQADTAIRMAVERFETVTKRQQDATSAGEDTRKKITEAQEQLGIVSRALASSLEVAKALPDDKQLAEAHAHYESRADSLRKNIEQLETQLGEQTKEIDDATIDATSLSRELAAMQSDRIGLADMVAEARGAVRVFRDQQQDHVTRITECQQRLFASQLGRDCQAKLVAKQELEGRRETILSGLGHVGEELQQLELFLDTATQEVAAKQATVAELQKLDSANAVNLEAKRTALANLTQAASHVQDAAKQLSDPNLRAAAQSLVQQRDTLSGDLEATDADASERERTRAVAIEELESLVKYQQELTSRRDDLLDRGSELRQASTEVQAAIDTASVDLELASNKLRETWERRFVVRSLKPLSPEQLARSMITALGLKARFAREAEAEWSKSNQDDKSDQRDDQQRDAEILAAIQKRVSQVESTFVSLFAAPGGAPQDVFSATADQALFFANDGRVRNWLSASEGTLLHRLRTMNDSNELANELYLAVLSRPAMDSEKATTAQYLSRRAEDRAVALQELAWGLLTSIEFRFNH